METTQLTLNGEPASSRTIPDTLVVCDDCGDRVLRSRVNDHPHTVNGGRTEKAMRYIVETEVVLGFRIDVDPYSIDSNSDIESEVQEEAHRCFHDKVESIIPSVNIQDNHIISKEEAEPVVP